MTFGRIVKAKIEQPKNICGDVLAMDLTSPIHKAMLKMFLINRSYSDVEKERLSIKFMECIASTSRLKPYHVSVLELKKFLTRNWDGIHTALSAIYNEDCLARCCYEWLEILNISEDKLNLYEGSIFSENSNSNFDIISSYSSTSPLKFPVFSNQPVVVDKTVVVSETVSSIARKELVLKNSYKDQLSLYFDPKRKFINLKKIVDEEDRTEQESYRLAKLNLKVKIIKEKAAESLRKKALENKATAALIKESNQMRFQRKSELIKLDSDQKTVTAKQIQQERENAKTAVQSAMKANSAKALEVRSLSLALEISRDRNLAKDLQEKRMLVKKVKELQSHINLATANSMPDTISFLSAMSIEELNLKIKVLKLEKQTQLLLAKQMVLQTRTKQKTDLAQKIKNLDLLKHKIQDVNTLDLRCDSQISIYSNPKMQSQRVESENMQTELQNLLHR